MTLTLQLSEEMLRYARMLLIEIQPHAHLLAAGLQVRGQDLTSGLLLYLLELIMVNVTQLSLTLPSDRPGT